MGPREFESAKESSIRATRREGLSIIVEEKLREVFGEQVVFYKESVSNPKTETYYVSVNAHQDQIKEINKKIYRFINKIELPPPNCHEGFYNKDGFTYSGLAHFSQNIRELTLMGEESKKQEEYACVFFSLNDKLAKLASQGIVHRIRVPHSDIEQFSKENKSKKTKSNHLRVIK